MNGRSSKAAGVTKFRLKRVESDTNGRMQNARYGVDGLRTKKQDAAGNSSREYGVGINTSASTPLTQNSTAPSISYISGHMILGAEINGTFVYHLGDALSSVRDVVDDEGDVIRSFEFDEYGNLLNLSGSGAASPKTWIGGLSVNDDTADSGMFNMGHRNYAGGVLGRFISRDPIGHAGNLNLYAYPTNPVNFVDPSGLQVATQEEWDAARQAIVTARASASPRKYSQQQYMETLNATLRFLKKWADDRRGFSPEEPCLRTPNSSSVDTLLWDLNTAFALKHVTAGETGTMGFFNMFGAGATMQTTGTGGVRERRIYVNRDFLDEIMASGAGPAEIGAGLLHESGHLSQGCSRYIPGMQESRTNQIYDGDKNLTLRDTLQSYYESLSTSEQRRFSPHGYPFP